VRLSKLFDRLRRKVRGFVNRIAAPLRRRRLVRRSRSRSEGPPSQSRIVWTTLVTASQPDELEIACTNLRNLRDVLAWSSLTIDGTDAEPKRFFSGGSATGFDNVLWLTQPRVVSRRGHYAGNLGHFNRISLNYLRGWLCNIERGEEASAELICHTDGDWEITIRPASLGPLLDFFHDRPDVLALSRPLNRYLTQERRMWPDAETGGEIWYGDGMLSTNVVIAPISRIRPVLIDAMRVFDDDRSEVLERLLGSLARARKMLVAYPKEEYARKHLHVELVERRKPSDMWEKRSG
jgi:hypothetical protein